MTYANIITQQIVDKLPEAPASIPTSVGMTFNPTEKDKLAYLEKQGWRTVSVTQPPSDGCRVDKYLAVDVDGLTCRLNVVTETDLAAEAAAAVDAKEAFDVMQKEAMAKAVGDSLAVKVLVVLIAKGETFTIEDCVAEARKQLGI